MTVLNSQFHSKRMKQCAKEFVIHVNSKYFVSEIDIPVEESAPLMAVSFL